MIEFIQIFGFLLKIYTFKYNFNCNTYEFGQFLWCR